MNRKRSLAAALAAAGVLAACGSSSKPYQSEGPTPVVPSSISGVVSVQGLGHDHFQGVHLTYSRTPPLGGDHSPAALNCAVYTAPVPNENAVHSLEHGGVWLSYQTGVDPAPLAALAPINPPYVLVSPYPSQTSKVVATAWGYQLRVDSATDPRLSAFVKQYAGGGQGGEKGAACAGVTPAQAQQLLDQGPPKGQATPPVPADKVSGG